MAGSETPSDNLYVMGLPLDIDDLTLRQVFEQFGMVVQAKILPPMDGKKERHAFVRYATVEEALNVRGSLTGTVPPGLPNPVNIRFAHAKGNSGGGGGWGKGDNSWGGGWNRSSPYGGGGCGGCGGGGGCGGSDYEAPSDNLYVSGLPAEIDDESLRELFSGYGNVVQWKVMPPRPGQTSAVALVRYQSEPEATAVKNLLNGNIPEGLQQPITIKYKAGDGMKAAGKGAPWGGGGCGKGDGFGGAMPSTSQGMAALGGGEEVPCDNLYIKGLPVGIDDSTLYQVFCGYGPVTSCRVLPSSPGAHDSVALVRFASVETATWVKDNLHGNIPQGFEAPVYIKYKTGGADKGGGKGGSWASNGASHMQQAPRAQAPGQVVGPPGGGGGCGFEGAPSDNLYVTGLPAEADDSMVREIFSQYGSVVQCKVMPPKPGQQETVALVRYSSVEEATAVKENLDGNIPNGFEGPVGVRYKTDKGGGKGDSGGYAPAAYSGGVNKSAGLQEASSVSLAETYAPVETFSVTNTGKMIAQGFEDSGALPGGSAATSDKGSVYVAGLPPLTEDLDLYRIFAPFGAIKVRGVKVVTNPDGTCKGFGFVNFIDPAAAAQAVGTCDGAQLPDGSFLKVSVKGQR